MSGEGVIKGMGMVTVVDIVMIIVMGERILCCGMSMNLSVGLGMR